MKQRQIISVRGRRGLSFAELIIGVAITAVLMLALAGFTLAVSTGWRHSDSETRVRQTASRSAQVAKDLLATVLCVMQVSPGDAVGGSAYLFYWQADNYAGVADSKAQLGEMALLEYDPTNKTVWLYSSKDYSTLTTAQKTAASSESWGDYTSPSIIAYYKSQSFVAPRVPLAGGYSGVGGGQVTSMQLALFTATNAKPVVGFQIGLSNAGAASVAYGNAALRAPQKPTNIQ